MPSSLISPSTGSSPAIRCPAGCPPYSLEHARIYYFHNDGAEEYFIGSADSMKRNLESRVEILVPVEDAAGRRTLRTMLDLQLAPNRSAWRMQSDGSYVRTATDSDDRGCQQGLYEWLRATHATEPLTPPRRGP